MVVTVICFLMEKKSVTLTLIINMLSSQRNFVYKAYQMNAIDSREVSLEGNLNYFSVGCNAINKSNFLSIHR